MSKTEYTEVELYAMVDHCVTKYQCNDEIPEAECLACPARNECGDPAHGDAL